MAELTFAAWMAQVDRILMQKGGLSHHDLADQTWRDWYDDEVSPANAAWEALDNEGLQDFFEE